MVDFSKLVARPRAVDALKTKLADQPVPVSDRSEVLWNEGNSPVVKVAGPLPTEVAAMAPPLPKATYDPNNPLPAKKAPAPRPVPLPAVSTKPEIKLSAEQESAADKILHAPGHCVLTGAAGGGKSTVVNAIRARRPVGMCSTTAKSALLIGGVTVDKMFAFGRDNWKVWSYDYLTKCMDRQPPIIFIDEAGAAGANMCNLLYKIAKSYGKRLVLVGDWAQTMPVKDEFAVSTPLFTESTFVKLTECHRQTDRDYLDALNDMRIGSVTDKVREVFRPCIVDKPPEDDTFIRGFATNRAADEFNAARLHAVQAPLVCLETAFNDVRRDKSRPYEQRQIDRILRDCRFAHDESFRVGARIVMRTNEPGDGGRFVNGDQGVLVDVIANDGRRLSETQHSVFAPNAFPSSEVRSIIVHLDRYPEPFGVDRMEMEVRTVFDNPEYTLKGFPISLGWAMTLHSSQGMTVDKFFVDMGTISQMQGESKHGLAYVAFSRTRTLQGLQIANWTDRAVYCSDTIKPYI